MFKSVPVLCYHKVSYVGGITPEQFNEHLEFLYHNKYTTISVNDLYNFMVYNKRIPKKSILITFDDCTLDNWVYAIPLLNKYGFKGIFFAITSFIGSGDKRNQYPSDNLPKILDAKTSFVNVLKKNDKSQFMNENEIYSAVYDYGHEIHSHSVKHQMCFKSLKLIGTFPDNWHWGIYGIYKEVKYGTKYFEKGSAYAYDGFWPYEKNGQIIYKKRNAEERYKFCLDDFTRSRQHLEEIINKPVEFFCWPWGQFDEVSMNALKESGYKGSFTLERFPNSYGTDPFYINRIAIGDKKHITWLKQKLKIYSNKITATIFFKKFKKEKEINSILFITDSNKYSSGGIRQLSYNIESLFSSNLNVYLICKKDAEISNLVSKYCKKIYFTDFRYKILAAFKLLQVCKNEKVDVIHTYHNKGHKLGFWLTLLHFHKNRLFVNRGVLNKPNNLFYYVSPLIDGFTCNSNACRNVLASRFISKSKINLIYNHIKLISLPKKQSDNEIPLLCYIGNNNPVKGFDIFNEIFSELRKHINIKAYAVGINKDRLKTCTHPDIKIIPETKYVFSYLVNSDIFVLTSRSESFPNVVLEAMLAKLPIIASNVGAVPEIIEDGKMGFVCKNNKDFVNNILHLIRNKELRMKIGEYNFRIVKTNFDINLKSEKLLRVYSGEHYIDKIIKVEE
ncbi:glycosyltransferase [Deferribacter abyssi]|uniref:glycosyltransferase n=1 Tax=Deferribacter abyssi TaxID=213806 RepID=UPI003C2839B8